MALSWALLVTALACTFYLAVEPHVRRRQPHLLVSWSRLLAGQLRDPVGGRDLLIGAAYGGCLAPVGGSDNLLLALFREMPPPPDFLGADPLDWGAHAGRLVVLILPAFCV